MIAHKIAHDVGRQGDADTELGRVSFAQAGQELGAHGTDGRGAHRLLVAADE